MKETPTCYLTDQAFSCARGSWRRPPRWSWSRCCSGPLSQGISPGRGDHDEDGDWWWSPKIMLIVFDILERMTPGEIRQNPINGHLGKEVLLNHPQVVLTDVQLKFQKFENLPKSTSNIIRLKWLLSFFVVVVYIWDLDCVVWQFLRVQLCVHHQDTLDPQPVLVENFKFCCHQDHKNDYPHHHCHHDDIINHHCNHHQDDDCTSPYSEANVRPSSSSRNIRPGTKTPRPDHRLIIMIIYFLMTMMMIRIIIFCLRANKE